MDNIHKAGDFRIKLLQDTNTDILTGANIRLHLKVDREELKRTVRFLDGFTSLTFIDPEQKKRIQNMQAALQVI